MNKVGDPVPSGSSSGPATDRHNTPVVDPTANVLQLVEAAVVRLNDLAKAHERRIDEKLDSGFRNLRDMMDLRAEHGRETRQLNDDRLEKIRQVDVAATKTEADRALTAIQALAARTATDAENIRKALDSAAAAIAKSTSDTVAAITSRLASLEKTQYETAGRGAVANPQLERFMERMEAVFTTQTRGSGKSEGVSQTVVAILGALGGIGTLLGIYAALKP